MKSSKLFVFVLVVAVGLLMSASLVAAQDGTVIRIASQSPLSGGQSVVGTAIRNGTELAIMQLSGRLNELGYTVEFIPYDDAATPEVGVSNAQLIVNDPAILAVVGHYNSGVAIPSSEVYNDNDLVMVSPANTGVNITDRGYPTVNRICGRDDAQGAAGAQFAATLEGVSSVYVLHDTTTYGQGVANFFSAEAENQGLTVLGFEGTEEAANFEGVLQPILALSPDLVYFGGIYDKGAILISQLRAAGYAGYFLGPDGMDSSEFGNIAGEAAVGVYYTTTGAPVTLFPDAAQFVEDYVAEFDMDPQPYAAQSYDVAGLILAAITQFVETNGTLPTRAEVATAVRATSEHQGITGTYSFDANGDPTMAAYYIIRVDSADPAEWGNNTVLSTQMIPSPLTAAAMMEATPEAGS